MMNIVAHNLLAMNANRQFGITNKKKAKSTEKLSSGYKINRAADDAAGLSISEKMRRQIRGLNKAEENIQDGISLCQVADGALNEIHDILQRMNELAVKAGNDTNSLTDRGFIQTEIDVLTEEIDRIAYQTTFNEEIYPLLGKMETEVIISPGGQHWVLPSMIKEVTLTFGNYKNPNGSYDSIGSTVNGINIVGNQTVQATCLYCELGIGKKSAMGDGWSIGAGMTQDADAYTHYLSSGDSLGGLTLSELNIDDEGRIYYNSKRQNCKRYLLMGNFNYMTCTDFLQPIGGSINYILADKVDDNYRDNNAKVKDNVWIHMSTEPGVGMFIDLVNATAKGIGIENLDMSSMENAGNAINSIKGAIEKVSGYRNVFGSQQNRLEHAMRINANIAENTTDAESRIRDTDVAEELLAFSNENILAQAGQSMLSQANQSQQNILSLLS